MSEYSPWVSFFQSQRKFTSAKAIAGQYNYDSAPLKVLERTSRTSIFGHAESILNEIARCRRHLNEVDVGILLLHLFCSPSRIADL